MSRPQVSVIMPVYNAKRYLAEALESILTQTFRDYEFLIFDDGSTDGSLALIRQYQHRDSRIHLFEKEHAGYVPWLNEGIQTARGELIARMDADDVALPERFARQVEYLRDNPDAVAVGSDCLAIDPDGAQLHRFGYDLAHKTDQESLLNGMSEGLMHPSTMIRRAALISIGGYRQEFEFVEDYDLWFRLTDIGRLGLIPEVLLKHRLHDESVTSCRVRRQRELVDVIVTEHRRHKGLPPLEHSAWRYDPPTTPIEARRSWANLAAANGYHRTALKHAIHTVQHAPLDFRSWFVLGISLIPQRLRSIMKPIVSSLRVLKQGHSVLR